MPAAVAAPSGGWEPPVTPITPVTVVLDPDDTPACVRLVTGLADLGAGRVVCHPTPHDPSGAWLATDLLVALGKRLDAPAVERPGERWHLAGVWLRAEGVRDLFVLRAHLLTGPALARLAAQQQACGLRLWLIVHQSGLGRAQRRVLDPVGWRSMTLAAFGDSWSATGHQATPGPTGRPVGEGDVDVEADGFPAVPGADFPVFRAACRRLLDPVSFAQVDRCYSEAMWETLAWLATQHQHLWTLHKLDVQTRPRDWPWRDPDDAGLRSTLGAARRHLAQAWSHLTAMVARRLQALTATARAPTETLVRFRAAQAAFLRYGLLLQLDPAMLATLDPQYGRPALDAHVAARLRGCWSPQRAAAATIALATGATPDDLFRLNVGDLTSDGATVPLAGEPFTIPEYARSLVRALLLERADQHATPTAALFINRGRGRASPDTLRRLLDHTATLAGVAVPSIHGAWRPAAWLVEHGLTLSRLAAPPPDLHPR